MFFRHFGKVKKNFGAQTCSEIVVDIRPAIDVKIFRQLFLFYFIYNAWSGLQTAVK